MARVRQTIHVRASIEAAFDYVADLSTTAEWDPNIAEASRLDVGPSRKGSRFRLVPRTGARSMPLESTITRFDRPRRLVFDGGNASFRRVDDLRFESAGGGTMITFVADLRLRGVRGLANPFLRGRFEASARSAVAGLQRELNHRAA
jgi:hypothetical protein